MASTPVDDHTEEFEQLAGLSALDVLEGEERDRFEAHAAGCERCRMMVRLDREALARSAPEMDPSPDFKQRLLQRAAAELAAAQAARPDEAAQPNEAARPGGAAPARDAASAREAAPTREAAPADGATTAGEATREGEAARVAEAAQPERRAADRREPTPLRPHGPNVIPFWRRSRLPSVLAAVFAIALVSAGAFTYQNQVVATYALSGSVPGSAVVNVRRSGAAELEMRGVQNPSPGFVYEAWIIPSGGAPVAAGVTPSGDATLPLQGLSSGATVAITQERARVDAPTSPVILMAVVQS